MRRILGIGAVAGLWLTAGSALAQAARAEPEFSDAHDFGCVTCHSPHRPKGPSLFPSPLSDKTEKGTPLLSSEGMCYSCHRTEEKGGTFFEPGMSHPVHVLPPPGMVVPKELGTRLVKGLGEVVTCVSCHDPHSRTRGFLKVSLKDDQLCISCHTQMRR